MSDNIFREVDEELRNERIKALWRRYGMYVIAGAVAIVLIVAGNELWQWWQGTTAGRSSDLMQTALDAIEDGDVAAAETALAAVEAEGSGRYPVLARFREAALMAEQGRTEEALAQYDALAGTVDSPLLRELAQVYAGYLLVDSGDVAAVTARVGSLLSPEHPLRNSAREALGLAAHRSGDNVTALAQFQQIVLDPLTAQDIMARAQVYIAQLTAEGVTLASEEEAAPAEDAAPAETPAQ